MEDNTSYVAKERFAGWGSARPHDLCHTCLKEGRGEVVSRPTGTRHTTALCPYHSELEADYRAQLVVLAAGGPLTHERHKEAKRIVLDRRRRVVDGPRPDTRLPPGDR